MSVPTKSARRIFSLLSIRSNKDPTTSPESSSPLASPRLFQASPKQLAVDTRDQSNSLPHSPTVPSESHHHIRSVLAGDDDLNADLLPPPSLVTLNVPPSSPDGRPQSQTGSRPSSSAGGTSTCWTSLTRPGTPADERLVKRRSRIPSKSPTGSMDRRANRPDAWIAGIEPIIPYDIHALAGGEQIPELWDDEGDTFVYLFPQNARRPPSFKIYSTVFADSPSLTFLAHGTDPRVEALRTSTQNLSIAHQRGVLDDYWADNDAGSSGSGRMNLAEDFPAEVQPLHLYMPVPLDSDVSSARAPRLSANDMETLMLFRNLFAFLIGQSLVATPRYPNLFSVFLEIATLLKRFEFSNLDGSNFGEMSMSSFSKYCDELQLADVRKSHDKTIEAIVLGERLKYYPLFVEGFVHGVGKAEEIRQLKSPKYDLISPVTQKRLERGYIDLENRVRMMRVKLEDFDFPSLFSGIANSNMTDLKTVHFKAWKGALLAFRKFILQYYRQKYGSWPPKAGSKKNEFEGDGLNRLLLNELYRDFSDLYDMLVDRTALTTRTTDMASDDLDAADPLESQARALRRIMSEYDRSTPPVQPPIPFDLPQFPSLFTVRRKPMDPKTEMKERHKKIKDAEINEILVDSYTHGSMKPTPFIESFMQFERRSVHGKNIEEIIDNRCGQWLFLYAVIQSLPLLVVDAPDIMYTDGVEYFLCVAPRGGAPWVHNDSRTGRSWFGVTGGTGVVSLPSDIITNGVEGVYRRSHCWQVATQWAEKSQLFGSPLTDDASSLSFPASPAPQSSIGSASDIVQPPSLLNPISASPLPFGQRTSSPNGVNKRHSTINVGLEALPLPPGIIPVDPPTAPFVRHNPHMSFDDILKEVPQKRKK
ncbi:hypothetical protein Egran_05950 [Elaphomyces granulatus]|uniref:DUF8004 domain-containing protein n=1 Tax=Elaphomyces granulatus TaxID=519963 RepID=A0A232LQ71_9EURO|nr:hypothetical protein Egran_05950 [Elaphomyces granulatus]